MQWSTTRSAVDVAPKGREGFGRFCSYFTVVSGAFIPEAGIKYIPVSTEPKLRILICCGLSYTSDDRRHRGARK